MKEGSRRDQAWGQQHHQVMSEFRRITVHFIRQDNSYRGICRLAGQTLKYASVICLLMLFCCCQNRAFQVESSSGCTKDYLEIREGNATGTLAGKFCGDSLPSNYTSTVGHILWVKFVSDSSGTDVGFRATFSHCK